MATCSTSLLLSRFNFVLLSHVTVLIVCYKLPEVLCHFWLELSWFLGISRSNKGKRIFVGESWNVIFFWFYWSDDNLDRFSSPSHCSLPIREITIFHFQLIQNRFSLTHWGCFLCILFHYVYIIQWIICFTSSRYVFRSWVRLIVNDNVSLKKFLLFIFRIFSPLYEVNSTN